MVPGWTATGAGKAAYCHPLADSPVKLAVPSSVPFAAQSRPTCAPVLAALL